ncbi:uncharacterized protein BO80DRAFT_435898 [Aspergillus ibericus CBS 121593]|uniref:Uncharacterized protein n=1 Tax=Aspergillus ibericus CBS 121593 TaxID=1448316 RepID=A0A395GVL0_9EURO|nr:hypothetical protein BO80DRAFT_435898 [Aspergillus ibericus CBS 121593]RAK99611.1 hypothetical protein BO80DRAFT_435898 [Aspergillus ibericus CBS 121593]
MPATRISRGVFLLVLQLPNGTLVVRTVASGRTVCGRLQRTPPETTQKSTSSNEYRTTRKFLTDALGIHVKRLRDKSVPSLQAGLGCGQLGFIGAYLDPRDFDLAGAGTERIRPLVVSGVHAGQFRFDGDTAGPVTELVITFVYNHYHGFPAHSHGILRYGHT